MFVALTGTLSAAGSGESSGGDAGGRALSLALLATIQAAADSADAEAAEPLPAAVNAIGAEMLCRLREGVDIVLVLLYRHDSDLCCTVTP